MPSAIATPSEESANVKRNAPPASDGLALADALNQLDRLKSRPRRAIRVLGPNLALCTDMRVARVLMDAALSLRRYEIGAQVLGVAPDADGLLRAQLALAQQDHATALAALTRCPDGPLDRARYFGMRVRAAALGGWYTQAVTAVFQWATDLPGTPFPYRTLARALAEQDDPRAQDWFECALAITGGTASSRLDLAEWLIKQGKTQSARFHLNCLAKVTGPAARRRDTILCAL